MGGFLGKYKKRVTRAKDPEEVLTKLNQERDRLRSNCQQTERNVESDRLQAKQKLQEGNREEAKILIKKKIYHERELHQSNAQLDKLDEIIYDIELARVGHELNNFEERKVKRGRWKSIIKRRHKRRHDSRKTLGKPVHEDIAIQIFKESRKGIVKQNKINELLSGQLSKGDETAVENELVAIMNANYQLPAVMDQENYAYNSNKEGFRKAHGSAQLKEDRLRSIPRAPPRSN